MKLKVFDVVELKNGDKATIKEVLNNEYKVEIVNDNGKLKGIQKIAEKDINKIIISKC